MSVQIRIDRMIERPRLRCGSTILRDLFHAGFFCRVGELPFINRPRLLKAHAPVLTSYQPAASFESARPGSDQKKNIK